VTVVTAAEMRALDRWTIEHGTPGAVLMERAGGGAARVLRTRLRAARGPVVVLCGRGNNGGDGFVIARHLRRARVPVEVWLAAHPADVRGDAADMLAAWRRGRNPVHDLTGAGRVAALGDRLAKAAVTVDALLGTGLNAPVTGLVASVIESVNRWSASSGRPVLAVDIASGLSADSGHPLGVAIRATVTATFGCAKIGQVVHPGVEHTGVLDVVDIGIPPAAMAAVAPATTLLEARDVAGLLPPRPRDAHKGTFGHVLVIGGSRGKTGAALLAAEGAARAGAGLTTLAVPAVLQPVLEGRVRELMTAALGDLDTLLAGRAAVVCGPGLGVTPDTRALVANVVRHATVPVVLDADALASRSRNTPYGGRKLTGRVRHTVLRGEPVVVDADALNIVAGTTLLSERAGPTVLTPHPGEMSRLLGCDTVAVQSDRLAAARRFAAAERVIVALKGARTVIAAPDGRAAISPTGNPGMASGGMGDVLAGVVGALLGQGLEPFAAAVLAVFAHGAAADRVAARRGEVGLIARDVLEELPPTFKELQEAARAHA